MSDQPHNSHHDEAGKAGSTSQEYGNLSVEDDAECTVDPAELAGSGGPKEEAGSENP